MRLQQDPFVLVCPWSTRLTDLAIPDEECYLFLACQTYCEEYSHGRRG